MTKVEDGYGGYGVAGVTTATIQSPPKMVGGYDISGGNGTTNTIVLCMTKKPKWLHRTCSKLFLGWVWVDNKN